MSNMSLSQTNERPAMRLRHLSASEASRYGETAALRYEDKVMSFNRKMGLPADTSHPASHVLARFAKPWELDQLADIQGWKADNGRDCMGNTPGHIIALRLDASPALIGAALNAGIKFTGQRNSEGRTAFDIAKTMNPSLAGLIEAAITPGDAETTVLPAKARKTRRRVPVETRQAVLRV